MIDGLTYIPNFVSAEEESEIIKAIDAEPWDLSLKRRTQHYGYRYDYTQKTVDRSFLGPLPSFVSSVVLAISKATDSTYDQLIVNEYEPGVGIAAHADCIPCFGPVICSLSLGSGCMMDFCKFRDSKPYDRKPQESQYLEPRSLVVLSGPARYDWTHAIPSRKQDTFFGVTIDRTRRVSLTFRKVI